MLYDVQFWIVQTKFEEVREPVDPPLSPGGAFGVTRTPIGVW